MGSTPDLPYWQVNVPEDEREATCPPYLENLSEKDQGIISTPDADYTLLSWSQVRKIIQDNRLDQFMRLPSELRRYLAYKWRLKQKYGSVMEYMLRERLGWTAPTVARGRPFEYADDVKCLLNDWPYGLDGRIKHLVVWTSQVRGVKCEGHRLGLTGCERFLDLDSREGPPFIIL